MKIKIITFIFILLTACQKNLLNTLPKPVDYKPPTVSEFDLTNGIHVYFLKDEEIPLVRGAFYFPYGSLWEEEDQKGSFGAMGTLMRKGGAGAMSADALDQRLEALSASISSGNNGEYGTVGFGCLTIDTDEVLGIVSDVIRKPRFEEKKISLWRSQAKESIYRRGDSPETIADIALTELLFKNTPFGRVLKSSDVDKIDQDLLKRAYKKLVRPNGALLAVTGDIEESQLQQLLEKHFGDWKNVRDEEFKPLLIENNDRKKRGVYFIEKPFSQATVLVGMRGPARLPADYPAIDAFNMVFGADGGFSSRLMQRVRSDRGLAYSVTGGIYPGFITGKNIIGLQTKGQTAGDALTEALAVLDEMKESTIPKAELEEAVSGSINSFVFKFDSPDDLVQREALLSLLKYPDSYDDTYISKLKAVRSSDIEVVAKKYWNYNNMVIVVVGDKSARKSIERQLPNDVIIELGFNETTIFDKK